MAWCAPQCSKPHLLAPEPRHVLSPFGCYLAVRARARGTLKSASGGWDTLLRHVLDLACPGQDFVAMAWCAPQCSKPHRHVPQQIILCSPNNTALYRVIWTGKCYTVLFGLYSIICNGACRIIWAVQHYTVLFGLYSIIPYYLGCTVLFVMVRAVFFGLYRVLL